MYRTVFLSVINHVSTDVNIAAYAALHRRHRWHVERTYWGVEDIGQTAMLWVAYFRSTRSSLVTMRQIPTRWEAY